MTNYVRCPNPDCNASWGIEEISFQECDCCGWPDVDDEFTANDSDDFDFADDDDFANQYPEGADE